MVATTGMWINILFVVLLVAIGIMALVLVQKNRLLANYKQQLNDLSQQAKDTAELLGNQLNHVRGEYDSCKVTLRNTLDSGK